MFPRLRRRARLLLALAAIAILTVACAAPADTLARTHASHGDGFLRGLWQGFIMPFALIASALGQHVGIYSVHNNGNWYNFGYVVGAFVIFGVVWHSHHVRKLRRRSS